MGGGCLLKRVREAAWLGPRASMPACLGDATFSPPPSNSNARVLPALWPVCAQFFMAPSLTTGKGELKMGGGFSQYRHRTTGPAVAVLELR